VDGDTNGWGRPSWGWTFDGDRSFADVFLTPTRLYVSEVLSLARANQLHAAAHITGGGLVGNLPRVIPDNLTVKIDQPWTVPAEFGWLKRRGHLSNEEMLRTFNCGVGMVLVVPEHAASSVLASHDGAVPLGIVVAGDTPEITLPYDDWWL
jgi:phosphoribosylaminoimidazole (AIR) synthetase